MGYCVACAKDINTGEFCPTCGRQLLTAQDLKAEPSTVDTTETPLKSKGHAAIWAHLAPILLALVGTVWIILGLVPWQPGLVLALVLWLPGLVIGKSSASTAFEKLHGTESLNFQLTILAFVVVGTIFCIATVGIGLLLVGPAAIALAIAAPIFMVGGTLAARFGREFRYPLSIRFVK